MNLIKKCRCNEKNIEIAMLLGMAIALFCASFCCFAEDYSNITGTVFRLHILANSDASDDQLLKLKVRDAVLEENSYIFENSHTAEEASLLALMHMDEIKCTAERIIAENGVNYDVKCEVTEMWFDNRIYDTVTMPAGKYKALRIIIGEAKGKNWWCVMFPQLCLPSVTNVDEALDEYGDVFTKEEINILKNPCNYKCKFYLLELFNKLKNTMWK